MSAIARAALLTICVSLYAGAQSRTLALYAGQAHGLDASATQSAQRELQRLLAPAGIELLWKNLENRKPGEQFDHVVVVSFDRSCSAPAIANTSKTPNAEVALADSSVSDGRVLPFIRVDCAYLAEMLDPALRVMSAAQRNAAIGRALGRVVAHEIYHVIGGTTEHQARGVAKAAFSVRDLMAETFDFDNSSLGQMRPAPTLSSSSVSASEEFLGR
jgi:hypothetical protein